MCITFLCFCIFISYLVYYITTANILALSNFIFQPQYLEYVENGKFSFSCFLDEICFSYFFQNLLIFLEDLIE